MNLDYSKLAFDQDGNPEMPELMLRTRSDQNIGTISGASNVHIHVKFVEPSEITFDVASYIDGKKNAIYDKVSGHKIVYTEQYGVYLLMNPETEADGIAEVKHVTGYSLEKELETKRFFIEEGTYRFYDLPYIDANGETHNDSILGRALECAPGWTVESVAPAVAQRYRTFDEYDDYVLPFLYNNVQQAFRCVFVFDTYRRTITVLDADAELEKLPIYLDFENLLKSVSVAEKSEELTTALRPYGSDAISIYDVNPIGTNWMYDLSYFISNGDIPKALGDKWTAWQQSIVNIQPQYRALCSLRASAQARLLAAKAKLADLEGELTVYTARQSVVIQSIAIGINDDRDLQNINSLISGKNSEISAQKTAISSIESEIVSYNAKIDAIAASLNIKTVFGSDYDTLAKFFIEQDITDDTFVATSVDASSSGTISALSRASISLTGSSVTKTRLDDFNKDMYSFAGGKFTISGAETLSGDIIRGTIEVNADNTFVLSMYAGTIVKGDTRAPSGMITLSGTLSSISSDVRAVNDGGVITYEGSRCSISMTSGSLYVTLNVSDYQYYAVQMELFDYAAGVLKDLSSPTYEFTVDSGNFIFSQEFSRFRNHLALGKGVYLRINDERVITPYIIEFELDFEDRSKFSLVFSNRFKLDDEINSLKDMLDRTYSSSRSLDVSKHSYNQTVGQMSMVSRLMQEQIDSAKNTILAARNQSVVIDGAGIHISCDDADDPYIQAFELRIVNGMIAMSRDNWNSVDIAIGVFKTSSGYHSGVNAQVVAGNMIIGHDLIIENPQIDENGHETGVMQFKVDSTGAWLNNSRLVLQKDGGGKMVIDPKYGLLAGTGSLFDVNGTDLTPHFIDNKGDIDFDADGMPKNANFFIDARDGSAYFRGNGVFNGSVYATDGEFSGIVKATDFQDSSGNSLLKWITDAQGNKNWKWKSDFLDLDDVNASIDTIENGYRITLEKYTETIQGYIDQVSSFEQTVEGFDLTVSQYTQDVEGYTQQMSEFQQTVNGFSTTVDSYTQAVDGYSRQVSNFSQTVNGFNTTVQSYAQDVNGYSQQVSSFEQTVEGFDLTVSQYTQDVEGYKTEVSQALKFDTNGVILTSYTPLGAKAVHFGNGNFDVYGGRFQVFDENGGISYGYIGHGTGLADQTVTHGVVMASGKYDNLGDSDYYVIVTDKGVRMQAPGNSIYVTSGGAFHNGTPIGAAVFM